MSDGGRAVMRRIDQHLGKRIAQAREIKRLSVEQIATSLNLSIRDYSAMERGDRRVGAFELAQLSGILGKTISWFYQGLPGQKAFERNPKSSSV